MVMHYDGMQDGALVRDQATRIAELEEALHVTLDEREEEMTRDEQAEAQLAEARAELASNKLVIDQLAHERNDTQAALEEATARAERAGAELKAMRRDFAEILVICRAIARLPGGNAVARDIAKVRAALPPSPAGRRFTGPGELEKSGYTAARDHSQGGEGL